MHADIENPSMEKVDPKIEEKSGLLTVPDSPGHAHAHGHGHGHSHNGSGLKISLFTKCTLTYI